MKVEIILPTTTFGRVHYKLLEPLCLLGHKVPVGFTSDGATVPRILWALFPPVGRYFLAAVLHDYLLYKGVHWMRANKAFLEALKAQKVANWVAYSMYAATVAYRGICKASNFILGRKGRR